MHHEDRESRWRFLLVPLSERWAYRYAALAILGFVFIGIARFASVTWLKKVGVGLTIPMLLWLFVMFVVMAPIVIIVQLLTRRSRRDA